MTLETIRYRFVTICASCRKVRDKEGRWVLSENYITDASRRRVSHGLCPDCARVLYPEFYQLKIRSSGTG